ncbi:MAG TPA: GIY-YIG nuclease family protein [Magnetospirillaceae bacterium]
MKREERKAAVAAYKERKVAAGIYALRCAATGQCWVGYAPNLDTIQNRLSFTLRQKSSPFASLQAAWTAHDADALAFEIVEQFDDEALAFARNSLVKTRLEHWCAALNAEAI